MARIRTIKPDFFRSRSLAKVTAEARLTFVGLWTEADDHGRGVADPRLIKGSLWPLDDNITPSDIEAHLMMLHESGHINLYEAEGDRYYAVKSWSKHQSAAYRRGEAVYPAPPDTPPPNVTHDQSCKEVQDASPSVLEGKGREGKGVSSQVTPVVTETTTTPVDNSTEQHQRIAAAYGRLMADTHNAGNRNGYATRAAANLLTERRHDIDRYINDYPTAPCDVIAAALAGQPGSLRYYADRTVDPEPAVDLVEPF